MESWMDDHVSQLPTQNATNSAALNPLHAGLMQNPETAARPSTSGLAPEQRFEIEAMPHLRDIFQTATRILGDRNRAEDVAQEVFLQAWKSFSRFEPGTNCRAWLFKILFHCVNHHRRKWYRFPLLKETEEFIEANLTYVPPVPEHLTDEEILAALDRIPTDFRAVVLLA